jgi:3',5'-cyclic AMP phosphodiesterase CpdA
MLAVHIDTAYDQIERNCYDDRSFSIGLMSLTILHLSDLHLGPGELRDEDIKQAIPKAERLRLIERLTLYLQALDKPDYLVISGDFTNAGNQQGLKDARTWLSARIDEGTLPGSERILVTPGNHDVKWRVEEKPNWHAERYEAFLGTMGKAFPHAYLPDCDPTLDSSKPTFSGQKKKGVIGGLTTKSKLGDLQIRSSYPFLLDLERDVLLFAFNSSLACGVFMKPQTDVLKNWENTIEIYREPPDLVTRLTGLHDEYKRVLLVDAGLIGTDQLEYFAKLMRRMKKELGAQFGRLTKIAVLHHHIGHVWRQQMEVKTFETVIDAAQLKQRLIEFGFDIVLHGHKHKNHIGLDSTVIPVSSARRLSPLCVISGGTVCGHPAPGDRQTFKLISVDEDSGRRLHARVTEIPLEDTGNPDAVIAESNVYNVPLAPRAPELHDFERLKSALDEFLISQYVEPQVQKHRGYLRRDWVALPQLHPSIASDDARYRCGLSMDLKGSKWLFEIVLATQRLDFQQRARLHWLLRDASASAVNGGAAYRVQIIIANFENTHFSQTKQKGEISESIRTIRQWFEPAVKSKLLIIRTHDFTQREVERLSAKVSRALTKG